MSVPRFPSVPPRRFAVVATTVLVALLALLASACGPRPTLRTFEQHASGTSLVSFTEWWRHEQAAANHVSLATVVRWWSHQPRSLDTAAARRRSFDVSTDFCSFAPDTGPTFDFRAPCVRHDFAWRNLKRLDALLGGGINTTARRVGATRQFLTDMRSTCAPKAPIQRRACQVVAESYYRAVLLVS